jgi:hypothetical protein
MPVELIIRFDGERIVVHGPLQDKILCLGLLELARDIVKSSRVVAPASPSLILPPNGG